ncbi:hypothetical protein PAXINDRAFT_156042 [Paxillus involutus ATCC 200175]|uniref:Uncharacterized protein n=1 Tax=Paxillus involutus ATCC 200175 TaxID=664439 RepID=A0A0C9TG16_PAXIN|nr:hypothetical protein PAXINDRAFT_156042 [Paxillus involutus ATCC 200175]
MVGEMRAPKHITEKPSDPGTQGEIRNTSSLKIRLVEGFHHKFTTESVVPHHFARDDGWKNPSVDWSTSSSSLAWVRERAKRVLRYGFAARTSTPITTLVPERVDSLRYPPASHPVRAITYCYEEQYMLTDILFHVPSGVVTPFLPAHFAGLPVTTSKLSAERWSSKVRSGALNPTHRGWIRQEQKGD